MPDAPAVQLPTTDRAWHAATTEAALEALATDPEAGLSETAAAERLERYGRNALAVEESESALWRFLRQFHDVLIYILLVAALVTAALGQWIDTGVIAAVVLVNAIIGYVQEGKAAEALESIRGMLSPSARVVRDGRLRALDATAVVPGDVVLVESGDRIPADVRWLHTNNLSVEEAVLTGESVPVEKKTDPIDDDTPMADRSSMGYSGTIVRRGRGRGVVVATGGDTEVGQIGTLMADVEELTTPLIQQINRFGKTLAGIILGLCALTFAYGYALGPYTVEEMFMIVVGLAVAAIPEGLPAILTITLALGVQHMADRSAILRKLPAVETLGSVSVICSDKTGTLTRNEMTVHEVATAGHRYEVTGSGYVPEGQVTHEGEPVAREAHPQMGELVRAGYFCSDAVLQQTDDAWSIEGDPTEGGLVVLAHKLLDVDGLNETHPRRGEVPFESDRQWMATRHDTPDGPRTYLKGAPERVMALCTAQRTREGANEPLTPEAWDETMDALAADGHRLLALGMRDEPRADALDEEAVQEGGFTLLGIVGLMDPPRPEVEAAVRHCQDAGITVKMITGDHARTAQSIGVRLGIADADTPAVTGQELEDLSDEELHSLVPRRHVFARTSPEHKLRIMEALQSHGKIVAMTGDGVNDAPALKRADVGIAMGIKGAEASKQAADMVLADDNFATIAVAVREGRTIYDNLKKAILFILPTNGAESLMVMATVMFAFDVLPVTPLQILWVNMVTAVTLALALAFEPGEADLMERPPRAPDAPILSGYLLWRIAYVSVLIAAAALWLFFYEEGRGLSLGAAQTIAVNTLVVGQIAYLFNTRFIWRSSLSVRRLLSNPVAWGVVGVLVLLQLAFTYAPLMHVAFGSAGIGLVDWAWIGGVGGVVFLTVEVEKAVVRWWQE